MCSSCQTRALFLDASGQGARQIGHPCPVAGGKRPVSRPADEIGIKPSLATTTAKASERVIADPQGWEGNDGSGGAARHVLGHVFVVPN